MPTVGWGRFRVLFSSCTVMFTFDALYGREPNCHTTIVLPNSGVLGGYYVCEYKPCPPNPTKKH